MKTVMMLTKRNILLYLKDKTTVFFSLLSMFIIIGLMVIFLGKMNVDNVLGLVSVERVKATFLVNSWVMAGIIVVNSVTVTLAVVGIMIEDEDKKRMGAFWVSPVSKFKLTLGYILAAFAMGCVLCFITIGVSEIYIGLTGGSLLSLNAVFKVIGITVVNVFASSCFIYFICVFIHTSSAFSAMNTIVGTLVGFISGMYLPMGMLPELVQKGVKLFPIVYGTSLMREVYVKDAIDVVFKGAPASAINKYKEYMGISVSWGSNSVDSFEKISILIGSSFLFILLALLVLQKRRIRDR
ncbi:ABC transporter permease [Inconstantimicrobium mannanitabidum]|uniref:ABC transporter n=1 Tax=Inconstantimicrobium mannanitabidum TaxID=1604901 RepID=A0ACB5RDD8_9CLOT|nr:ABC transporter permease [Clostridium sp. TW13]GKX67165.1 ABC transporter [Clostridium sp. TW13]